MAVVGLSPEIIGEKGFDPPVPVVCVFEDVPHVPPLQRCEEMNNMLTKYINNAMTKAVYDKLEDGSFSGKIPLCPGVIAFGETLYQCEQELKSSLEGWLIVKIRYGDRLPVIDRINLNERMPAFPDEAAAVHG
jgi:predicted RNase H-like HicB family nuclease